MERRSLETYAAQVTGLAFGLTGGVIVARALGPEGKGLYAWLMLWPALLVAAGRLGLDTALTFHGQTDPASRPNLRKLLVPVALYVGIPLAAGVFAVALAGSRGHRLADPALLLITVSAGPCALYVALTQGLLLGCGKNRAFNLLVVAAPALHAIALAAIWLIQPAALTLQTVLIAWAATCLGAAIFAFRASGRAARGPGVTRPGLLRRCIGYGLRVHVGGVAAHLNLRLIHFMVGGMAGSAALGIYSVASSGAEILSYFAVAESLVLFPSACALPLNERWSLVLRRSLRTLALFVAAALVSVFAVERVVLLLFGGAFLGVIPVFRLLLPGMAAHSLNMLLGSGLRASGKAMVPSIAAWVGLGTTAPLAPLVISRWGAPGGAVLFSAAQGISLAVLIWAALRDRAAVPHLGDRENPLPSSHSGLPKSRPALLNGTSDALR